jgi:hypothetical protein
MGVECKIYLVPRDRTVRPTPTALASLVEALRAGRWIFADEDARTSPATFKAHLRTAPSGGEHPHAPAAVPPTLAAWLEDEAANDVLVRFEHNGLVGASGPLRWPLTELVEEIGDEAYLNVELWLGADFIYVCSEQLDPLDDEKCKCGSSLEFRADEDHVFNSPRLRRVCVHCGALTSLSERSAEYRDDLTGKTRRVQGGGAFRAAVVVDLGKCFPRDTAFTIASELRALVQSSLRGAVDELVEFY